MEDAREVFVDMENMEHILEAFTKLRVGCIFKMVGFPVGVRGRVEAQYKINQLFPERNEIIASNIMASHNKKTFHIGDNLKILHEDMPRMSARID